MSVAEVEAARRAPPPMRIGMQWAELARAGRSSSLWRWHAAGDDSMLRHPPARRRRHRT
jgi:hypothetical protein